ncbi:MAG: TetR family transcriptional regulator [Myxococcales bacterium]|nr:TetR family transcriptional regulator [Myxococcales bacterium]
MSQDGDGAEGDDARLLEAAQELLDEHGPGFTMAQLAEASGISRATLYRRVPSREALAQRLREAGMDPGEALGSSSRERILDAVQVMLAEQGLSFTVEQLAERAEVGVATIYRSFGDRDGLLRTFFEERGPRRMVVAHLGDLDAPIEDTLRSLVASLLRFAIGLPGLARTVLLDQSPEAREIQRLRRGSRSTFSRLLEYVEAQVERGALVGDPFLLAGTLVGMVLGSTLLFPSLASRAGRRASAARLRPDDCEGIERRAAELVALWLRGARA